MQCESISTTGGRSESRTDVPRYVNDRRIQNQWKPIIGFGRAPVSLPPEWLGDFLEGGGRDKRFHVWGQPESELPFRHPIDRGRRFGRRCFRWRRDGAGDLQGLGPEVVGHGTRQGYDCRRPQASGRP